MLTFMETFSVAWRLRWWSDDGGRHDEQSVEIVEAADAWSARESIRRRTIARVDWPRHPFRLAFDDDTLECTLNGASYPSTLPHRHVLRARILAGTLPNVLFAELVGGGATRLDVLIGFATAFNVPHERAIDDLDAIAANQQAWSRAFRIRDDFDHGRSVVDSLHALYTDGSHPNSIVLGNALRDALELDFRDVKLLIELACHRDPRFDQDLAAAIKRKNS